MRDAEGRKEEARKVIQTAKQSNHPWQSLSQREMSCLGWDSMYMYALPTVHTHTHTHTHTTHTDTHTLHTQIHTHYTHTHTHRYTTHTHTYTDNITVIERTCQCTYSGPFSRKHHPSYYQHKPTKHHHRSIPTAQLSRCIYR